MTGLASDGNSDGEEDKKVKGPSIQCMIGVEHSLEQLKEMKP